MAENKPWYESWFDTDYYHLLYKNRNDEEARRFIDNLLQSLEIPPNSQVLDAACGKGRHSYYLYEKGMDVTGFDLSQASIDYAKKMENSRLHFYVHDIRDVFRANSFDLVCNLFTSFGYFEDWSDDLKAADAMITDLKIDGLFVFDYLNSAFVTKNLDTSKHIINEGNITFVTQKSTDGRYVYKNIEVYDTISNYTGQFQEAVRLYSQEELNLLFERPNTKKLYHWGDYLLNPFDSLNSPRQILVYERLD